MSKKTKVRFHLGAGQYFMHWQITYPNGDIQYVDPNKQNMVFHGCQLRNRPKTAQRIHDGGEKVVCAWIECDWIQMLHWTSKGEPVSYNPRISPHWRYGLENADNFKFGKIQSIGNKLIVI